MKPERLSRTEIYRCPWFNLYVDRVRFPNGRIVERQHLLDFEQPSVVALVENAQNDLLFVRVCRYTTGAADWELPAGAVEPGEEVIAAAQREVLEETGYRTDRHQLVHSFYPMSGYTNKVAHIVRCRATECAGRFEDEVSEIGWFHRDQVEQMLRDGVITCGVTLVALLFGLQQWAGIYPPQRRGDAEASGTTD